MTPEELEKPELLTWEKRKEISLASGIEMKDIKEAIIQYYQHVQMHTLLRKLLKAKHEIPTSQSEVSNLCQ